MAALLLRWIMGAVALYATSRIVRGISIKQTSTAFIAIAVIAFLNILVRPILFVLTIPFTVVTLGLFLFILNGFMFLLASKVVEGFEIESMKAAVIGAIVFSIISYGLNTLIIFSPFIVIDSY